MKSHRHLLRRKRGSGNGKFATLTEQIEPEPEQERKRQFHRVVGRIGAMVASLVTAGIFTPSRWQVVLTASMRPKWARSSPWLGCNHSQGRRPRRLSMDSVHLRTLRMVPAWPKDVLPLSEGHGGRCTSRTRRAHADERRCNVPGS